jgi:RNA polymerase sigma-54 factor
LLQPKLNLRVAQRQVLTPGLVQMVSVLALNKLELKDMINAEIIENPVLEEIEINDASLSELAGQEGDRERSVEEKLAESDRTEKDPFEEIDFGSYFQDYLDPGFRVPSNFEEYDKPSFENFLSQPSTLTDHLLWQIGALTLTPGIRSAAELMVGNLNEVGYLTASDEDLVQSLAEQAGLVPAHLGDGSDTTGDSLSRSQEAGLAPSARAVLERDVRAAIEVLHALDPAGVGARTLPECLLLQIEAQRREGLLQRARSLQREQREELADNVAEAELYPTAGASAAEGTQDTSRDVYSIAKQIVEHLLPLLQKKDMRAVVKGCGCDEDAVHTAVALIRSLDPRPGQRYNLVETRLIEPDIAFVKRDDTYVVVMNEEDLPTLRLNQSYRRMLRDKDTQSDVREYVKERYRSAIQLLRNIEQRKNTIVRTCDAIVRRQQEFMERGVEALHPMMIKEVAEEIGVHPSTVSRAVSNKYALTPQGVYELRFFFSEGTNGPGGGDLPLHLLKRKVKKIIEEEDPKKPLTDDQLAAELNRQGIQVTRRTVAKYREDLQIPSTHQRRQR